MSANDTAIAVLRGGCPAPFFSAASFPDTGGFIDGRLCQKLGPLACCLACPLVDYVYPDNFATLTDVANWVSVVSTVATVFLLLSWAFLPVDRTHRHYLSISLTLSVAFMNLGFIIPLASQPEQCYNEITPNDMVSSRLCASSGAFLLLGGWAGVMWAFIRSLSLHLQICWHVNVGRPFMVASHIAGWGIPVIGVVLALVLSGVSFRFGTTCHINHKNSLADFWVPLLICSGLTVVLTLLTFAYCVRVYLASLADGNASTQTSSVPPTSYATSLRTMSPRQAYRRVKRVIMLQWRGIAIVLIIITDVIFFSVVFVFQDTTTQDAQTNPSKTREWVLCLIRADGDKNECLEEASGLAVSQVTVTCVLLLLALNGIWLLFLLGRKDMVRGWIDLIQRPIRRRREFVSVDARFEDQKLPSSYEMLSRDSSAVVTPASPVKPPFPPFLPASPARSSASPDSYFKPPVAASPPPLTPPASSLRYQPHARSFSSPRPPQSRDGPATPDDYHSNPNSNYSNSNTNNNNFPMRPALRHTSTTGSWSTGGGGFSPPMASVTWDGQPPRFADASDGTGIHSPGMNRV